MSTVQERQVKHIYDAIDAGQYKTAIQSCNKLLKKQAKFDLVKALKALALVRSVKLEEGAILCDEILATNPTDELVLGAMSHALRSLSRHEDMVTMFDGAFKKFPKNGEYGAQAFMANVRIGNWKAAQQLANKLHKGFKEDRYLYWNVMCVILQANEPSTTAETHPILLKLALRLIASSSMPSTASPDRFYLHICILRDLQQFDEALKLLEGSLEGRDLCETSLMLEELRHTLALSAGKAEKELEAAKIRLIDNKDRNWITFGKLINCTLELIDHEGALADTRALLNKLVEEDGNADRSSLLAVLDLEHRVRESHPTALQVSLLDIMKRFFLAFGDKTACYEDIKNFALFNGEEQVQWRAFLDEQLPKDVNSIEELHRQINVFKMKRWDLIMEDLTEENETQRALEYLKAYMAALPLGKSLPKTELQPADDLAILTASAFVTLSILSQPSPFSSNYLLCTVVILEYAIVRSAHAFQLRLLLVRLYRLLGAPSLAMDHYKSLDIKYIQNDSMAHFVLDRCSTFNLSSVGDQGYLQECLESSQIYLNNNSETPDMVIKAFQFEKYTQIPEFIELEDRLDSSLQRDLTKMEHVRMRLVHEPANAETIDTELVEMKFLFERSAAAQWDNRDFTVIPDYQPRGQSLNLQTSMSGSTPAGSGWHSAWMKMYILVFQLASDLDPMLDARVILGDKLALNTLIGGVDKRPVNERIRDINEQESNELTADERRLRSWIMELVRWIEPHNEYSRPPPKPIPDSTTPLLASQSVNGTSSKDVAATNKTSTNGSKTSSSMPSSGEVTPAHEEPSEDIVKFFEEVEAAFKEAATNDLPWKQLHIASLLQESMVLYNILTARFRLGGGSKMKKSDPMMHSFKMLREKGLETCRKISALLAGYAEKEATQEGRRRFIEGCATLKTISEIDHDFILDIAHKTTQARKKMFEGLAKGLEKYCKGQGQGLNLASPPSNT